MLMESVSLVEVAEAMSIFGSKSSKDEDIRKQATLKKWCTNLPKNDGPLVPGGLSHYMEAVFVSSSSIVNHESGWYPENMVPKASLNWAYGEQDFSEFDGCCSTSATWLSSRILTWNVHRGKSLGALIKGFSSSRATSCKPRKHMTVREFIKQANHSWLKNP